MIKIPTYTEVRQTEGGHALGLYNFMKDIAEAFNEQEKLASKDADKKETKK